jgi:hypothetical protein
MLRLLMADISTEDCMTMSERGATALTLRGPAGHPRLSPYEANGRTNRVYVFRPPSIRQTI